MHFYYLVFFFGSFFIFFSYKKQNNKEIVKSILQLYLLQLHIIQLTPLQNADMIFSRFNITGIDWQVFYAYISVMKKSKEFWVDSGYLDDLNTQAQAREDLTVIQKDALGAVSGILFFLGSAILAATGIGVAAAVISISGIEALYSIGFTAALASIVPW